MSGRNDADVEAARVAEALRRAGGALPVERLRDRVRDADGARSDPARCVRRRRDLFLLVEHRPASWGEEWSPDERSEYERAGARRNEGVVLLDGAPARSRPPALVRETLLAMWGEAPDDEELHRALGNTLSAGNAAARDAAGDATGDAAGDATGNAAGGAAGGPNGAADRTAGGAGLRQPPVSE